MATKGPPSEAAMKERIITHMNNDHIDSVQRYVEHYNKVSRSTSRTARLVDISKHDMTINAGGSKYKVPFTPPMSSLTEARPRVVQMDADCIRALGRSPYTVKEFPRPPVAALFTLAITVYAILMLTDEKYILPGSPLYDYYLRFMPYLPHIFQKYRKLVAWGIIGPHLGEVYIMSGKLAKHSTPLYSRAWWLWVLSAFWVGFPTFGMFNDLVEQKRIAKEKAKH